MSLRTFLALDLDDSILTGLDEVRATLDEPAANIRWVASRNQHVTTHFLGDVPENAIPELCSTAAAAAGQIEPFDFEVKGVTCVPPAGRQLPMLWASINDPTGRLAELYELLATELEKLGFKREQRPFKPHLTLARIKYIRNPDELREAAEIFADTEFGIQQTSEIVVYSSKLTPQGPIYTPISKIPLKGKP